MHKIKHFLGAFQSIVVCTIGMVYSNCSGVRILNSGSWAVTVYINFPGNKIT